MFANAFELTNARPESMGKVSWDYVFKRPTLFVLGRNQSQLGTIPSYPMDTCIFVRFFAFALFVFSVLVPFCLSNLSQLQSI